MRKLARDAAVVAGVAAVTACAVFTVARPRMAVAEGEAKAAAVERPALKVDGVTLTLALDKQNYGAGEKPKLTLTAVNANTRPAKVDAVLSMLTTEAGKLEWRRMPMPKEGWRHECALKLAPGETKTVEVATGKALAAGQSATFNITVGKKMLAAARLVLPGVKVLALPSAKGQDAAKLSALLEKAKSKAQPPVAKSKAKTEGEVR
ncbi:MAG: hypothetical protein ACYS9X_19310 [Planctomycetota bacterium]|jgi:hypothetical protein